MDNTCRNEDDQTDVENGISADEMEQFGETDCNSTQENHPDATTKLVEGESSSTPDRKSESGRVVFGNPRQSAQISQSGLQKEAGPSHLPETPPYPTTDHGNMVAPRPRVTGSQPLVLFVPDNLSGSYGCQESNQIEPSDSESIHPKETAEAEIHVVVSSGQEVVADEHQVPPIFPNAGDFDDASNQETETTSSDDSEPSTSGSCNDMRDLTAAENLQSTSEVLNPRDPHPMRQKNRRKRKVAQRGQDEDVNNKEERAIKIKKVGPTVSRRNDRNTSHITSSTASATFENSNATPHFQPGESSSNSGIESCYLNLPKNVPSSRYALDLSGAPVDGSSSKALVKVALKRKSSHSSASSSRSRKFIAMQDTITAHQASVVCASREEQQSSTCISSDSVPSNSTPDAPAQGIEEENHPQREQVRMVEAQQAADATSELRLETTRSARALVQRLLVRHSYGNLLQVERGVSNEIQEVRIFYISCPTLQTFQVQDEREGEYQNGRQDNFIRRDNAMSEHRAHFPNCQLLLGTETGNVPVPDLPVATDVRQRVFPCQFPSNPHMRSEAARVETFDQRWPRNRTAATPAEIAQAGFFYLGERDRVKCWYCNGGLQHWEYDDVPWIEHAKWFPNCQFLLGVKGQHFVYRQLAMCPQLPRPIIARQDGSPLDPGSERRPSQPPEDIPPSVSRLRQPSPLPTIIDPPEEKRERIDSVLKNSDLVKNVLAMGFSEQIVRQLLVEKVDSGTEETPDDIYGTTLELLDDVMKREDELKQEEEQRSNIAAAVPPMPGPSTSYMPSIPPGSGKYNVSYFGDEDEEGDRDMYGIEPMTVETSMNSETPAKQTEGGEDQTSLQEALNKIEEERMCKVCFSNPADMVFVPCGHMCCCMECTKALRQCPVCRVKIQKAIKTYLS